MFDIRSNSLAKLKYLLVLDFEATCGGPVTDRTQEIIEFPTLVYNLKTQEVDATFHEYVRPLINSTLTPFCTELTGIEQVGLLTNIDIHHS